MLTLLLALSTAAAPLPPEAKDDKLLAALVEELERSRATLPKNKDAPLHYLSYRVADGQTFNISASLGALAEGNDTIDPFSGRSRTLDVTVRVGSRKLDNSHMMRGSSRFDFERPSGTAYLPIDDDVRATRIALWRTTDKAYKAAVKQLVKIKTNLAVKVAEEDDSDDFSDDKPSVRVEPRWKGEVDRAAWGQRVKKLSALFKAHPEILASGVAVNGAGYTAYFVDSDGARLREPRFFVRLTIQGTVKADDGMDLDLYDDVQATSLEQLPSDAVLEAKVTTLIDRLLKLKRAPAVEPYSGPAIITNRAAGVFFHEIFGHRIEGHRQKDADEGQTFTRKMGQAVLPDFLSVVDDPTQRSFGETPLNGAYLFDEEGQPAKRATLIDKGVLKGFLMGRSPVKGFPRSNGHGRAQPGRPTVARQGNLLIDSAKQVPFTELRAQLVAEAKRQGKPYGLVFQEISGGFTNTRSGWAPQAFKVLPLVVTRVYADGRPDELVRGVDMVGTPLSSFEKIIATGDDFAVFNGYCGAESGFIPVSAVAPSILVSTLEVEKKGKRHEKGPLLPSPLAAVKGGAK